MAKKKAHIVSHTHWDREWYINSKFVNEWLPPFFDGLFDMMEKEPAYRFVLDGQTSMIDDCYVELEKLGRSIDAFKEKVSYYAGRGQLILGPYYLQPDWQLVSGESLVRNMLIGRKMSHELGGSTHTGWLLDNFGQISQAPQLHKQFDMKGIVVWRGVELDPFNLNSEFEWVGADGTAMTCSYLLSSYRNAMHLADYPDILNDRIRNETEKIAPFATTDNVLLMNGYDQEMQPDNLLPFLADGKADFGDFEICQSTPDEYMDLVVAQRGKLQQLHGALYSGRYISVFPGILSARIYLKLLNDAGQRELEQYAEPLNAMLAVLGGEYPHEALENSWKLLLKNQPHDSICGVSVDDVHHDMEDRFHASLAISTEVTNRAAATLSAQLDTTAHKDATAIFTAFNTLPTARTCAIFLPTETTTVLVKDQDGNVCTTQPTNGGVVAQVMMPAFGASVLGLYPAEQAAATPSSELCAANEYLSVCCNPDGTLDVTDKQTGRVYAGVGALEDSADSGDEYNYSFPNNDRIYTTRGSNAQVKVVEQGDVRTVFEITHEWALPVSLTETHDTRSEELRTMPVITTVTLAQGDPVLRFHTAIRNTCCDHRVRVLFPTNIDTDVSYAQTQFDIAQHPIVPPTFDNDSIPEEVKRIIIGARECIPITQFPQRDFCAVTDGNVTAAVLNMGLPEYEVLPAQTTMALTLFRSIGWLARFDLNTRIGDAGPEMFTPGAQCLRDMEFDYGFCLVEGKPESKALAEATSNFTTPALVCNADSHTGAATASFASLASEGTVQLSAAKCAEDSKNVVFRLYNAGTEATTATLTMPFATAANTATPYEAPIDALTLTDGSVTLTLAPKEIISVCANTNAAPALTCAEAANTWKTAPATYDFAGTEIPASLTEADIASEEHRADEMEAEYAARLAKAEASTAALPEDATPAQRTETATLVMQAHAIHRACLEARLSAIFAREALNRIEMGNNSQSFADYQASLVPQLRELAYALNLARIDKRVSEYITDYYQHQEKLSNQ